MTLQPGDMIATGTPKGLSDVVPGMKWWWKWKAWVAR